MPIGRRGERQPRPTVAAAELEPLRERLPEYVAVFAAGAAGLTAVALLIFALTDNGLTSTLGYTFIFGGTFLLLVGGARGGGYTNLSLGAVEALAGGRNRTDDDFEDDDDLRRGNILKQRDPMERLRRGLRPPKNPTAFWQSIAGFAYMAIGAPLTF